MEGLSSDSVRGADVDTDVDVNMELCPSEKPGFKGSTLSARAGFTTFGKEKGVVVTSVD